MSTTTGRPARPDTSRRRTIVAAVVACLVFAIVTLPALAVRSPLGHDESVYALRSRDLLDGWTFLSGDYWRDYRAPGLPMMLAAIGRVIGVHVTTARLFVVGLAMLILGLVALLGRRLQSWSVGALAAALLVVSYGFVLTSTTLLADTPGATFALVAVVIYLKEMDEGRLRGAFVLVPLATFVSTMSRFGAPFTLGAGLLAAALVTAPVILRERNWRLVAESAALAVGTALVVALVLLTDTFTLDGSSPAAANSALVGKNEFTFATGLADLENVVNPWSGHYFPMWSKAVGALFLIGIVAAVVSVYFQRARWRVVVFALVSGLISVTAVVATVGLVVPNYLSLTVPFWAILAAAGWDWIARGVIDWGRRHGMPSARIVMAVAAVGFLVLAVDVGRDVRDAHHQYEHAYSRIRAASVQTHDQLGDDCVLIARYTPQAGYYSTCRISPFHGFDGPADDSLGLSVDAVVERWDLGVPPTAPVAAMVVENAIRQPDFDQLLAETDLFGERLFQAGRAGQRRRHVVVEVVEPCVADRSCPSYSE